MDKRKASMVVVCGPTASGKTGLAFALCRRFGGEMIGADSMQIYKGLAIGTAAPTAEEAAGVPVHLAGFLPPGQSFSVAEYVALAGRCVEACAARGTLPVVCGGTGLYIENLVLGTRFAPQPVPQALRARLKAELAAEGGAAMLARLREVDADCAARLHEKDHKRILRALEDWELTGQTAARRAAASRPAASPYRTLLLGLNFARREDLYARINQRVDGMLQAGLLDEAQAVYENRGSYRTAAQAIGYKEFFPYFEGAQPLAACVEALKQASRRYAKRQLTWFRRVQGIHWLDAADGLLLPKAEALVEKFLADGILLDKDGPMG